METVTEKWEKEFQAVADSINKNGKLLKEEKVAKIASGGAQMIHRATGLLSTYERSLREQRGKLDELLFTRRFYIRRGKSDTAYNG
jgi:hypothetical protein